MHRGTLIFVVLNTALWWAATQWQWSTAFIITVASLNGVFTTAWDLGWRGPGTPGLPASRHTNTRRRP